MSGAYLHSPNTPSWRGTQLKEEAQGKFYFYLQVMKWVSYFRN